MVEVAPRIAVDETVRFGRPVIAGTRVPVDTVVGKVASGMSLDEVAMAGTGRRGSRQTRTASSRNEPKRTSPSETAELHPRRVDVGNGRLSLR